MIRKDVFSVLLSMSLLALGMCVFRTMYTRDFAYAYMLINLILAWIPLFLSFASFSLVKRKQWLALGVLGFLWFLFYPNTLYLITDYIHLRPRPMIPLTFDAMMLTLFAISGVTLAFLSLAIIEHALKKHIHGEWFASTMFVIASYGVFIGRFLRWNSWDLLVYPGQVGMDLIFFAFTPKAIAFTLALSVPCMFLHRILRPKLQSTLAR